MSIRKQHHANNALEWSDETMQEFAEDMGNSMFDMEWLPPGRGLWMMGTDFCYERGSMALNNCSATCTEVDLVHSAEWTMDDLMNGVGVEFSTKWRGTATKPDKTKGEVSIIPDSREGWADSLTRLMCSYIDSPKHGKNQYPVFDYSQIRKKGETIKGFGGHASGSEPLEKMHKRVEGYLDAFCEGELKTNALVWTEVEGGKWEEVNTPIQKPYGHTRLIADVFNAIGACVVAGNVRRSAEIALGSEGDDEFIDLKNYEGKKQNEAKLDGCQIIR